MKTLTTLFRHTFIIVCLSLATITHSHAAMSPELASALQNKFLTEEGKALINQSEELQALYQYLLIDRKFTNDLEIDVNKIDTAKIPTAKDEYGFSDYIAAIVSERRLGYDGVMVDNDGSIRHLRYRPQSQEDIDFLSRFKKLNHLRLRSYSDDLKHVSLANLAALKELQYDLGYTEKLDFGTNASPLSAILIMNNGKIKTLANIKYLENLEYLTVFPSSLSDYTQLEHNTNLKRLYLEATTEIRLPDFSNLKNLHSLYISAKEPIIDISLKNCSNLVEARLRPVKLESIKLPESIKKLRIDGTDRNDNLSFLSHLNNLEDLSLGNTLINSLEDLPKLEKLTRLELGDNEINSLDGLDRFPALIELRVFSGNLTAPPNLTKLPNLDNLILIGHEIEKIDHIQTWKNLEKINLRSNKIKKLDGLRYLTSLKEMDLRDNPLREVSQADLDALVEQKFEGYFNVKGSRFGVDIRNDDELIKKYYFFKDPKFR